jgi:hypothetical protein
MRVERRRNKRRRLATGAVANRLRQLSKLGKRCSARFRRSQTCRGVPKHSEIDKSTRTYEYTNKNTKLQDVYKGTNFHARGQGAGGAIVGSIMDVICTRAASQWWGGSRWHNHTLQGVVSNSMGMHSRRRGSRWGLHVGKDPGLWGNHPTVPHSDSSASVNELCHCPASVAHFNTTYAIVG